jgi:hypothetical protein
MYFQHICPGLSPPAKTSDYEADRIIHVDTVLKNPKRLKPRLFLRLAARAEYSWMQTPLISLLEGCAPSQPRSTKLPPFNATPREPAPSSAFHPASRFPSGLRRATFSRVRNSGESQAKEPNSCWNPISLHDRGYRRRSRSLRTLGRLRSCSCTSQPCSAFCFNGRQFLLLFGRQKSVDIRIITLAQLR